MLRGPSIHKCGTAIQMQLSIRHTFKNNRERSGRGFESHRRHCVVSLSKNIHPSLVLVQHRKTRPFITERLLMGRKESNQNIKYKTHLRYSSIFGNMCRK